eukprot:m.664002 g.664002  ORF g.664002 m.664002 type:complete len:442 (+) comp22745_c0_seq20:75-1400(+)
MYICMRRWTMRQLFIVRFRHRLDAIARDVGLSCDFDEDNESYLLASSSFYIEINVDAGGTPKAVNVVHGAEAEEDDRACLQLLQHGKFDDVAASIERLKDMHRPHAQCIAPQTEGEITPRFAALLAFEKDLSAISAFEKSMEVSASTGTTTVHDVITRGHGLIRPRSGVQKMSLVYFLGTRASRIASTARKSADVTLSQISELCTVTGWAAQQTTAAVGTCAHVSVLDIIQGSATAATIQHVQAVVPANHGTPEAEAALCEIQMAHGSEGDPTTATPAFAAVLHLDQPLVCTREVARRLWQQGGMADDASTPTSGNDGSQSSTKAFLSQLLLSLNAADTVLDTSAPYYCTSEKRSQSYHFNAESPQRTRDHDAVVVDRIPFTSADRVHGLLTLLRQQSTINSLLYVLCPVLVTDLSCSQCTACDMCSTYMAMAYHVNFAGK